MEKRTTHFLNKSLILVSVFCIIIFISQTLLSNIMGGNTIRQLGVFYMSGISEQVTSHFETIIDLRLSQVESLVNSVPPGRTASQKATRISLTYNARSLGFEYLAYYTEDGGFHMIYGSQVTADVPEDLHRSVQGGKYNVCAGKDARGTPVVLIGVPAIYPVEDGISSIALIAGMPTSYLSEMLESNIQSSIFEYSIIRTDGSYVLNNRETEDTNYFDRVEELYEPYGGKTPAQYVAELRNALETSTDYTSEARISGEHWNVYCTGLPNSQWHLLLKVSHNTLDETVNRLQQKGIYLSIGSGCLIIGALLLVFVGYYRLTEMHMDVLKDARKTAEQAQLSAERSNRAKNEFLSNMSHDIRTPMNGIMGMTSIAINSLDDPSRVRTCLKKIHISSRHLLGLINDMLDMSKIESGDLILNMEPVSLRDIMLNIMTLIQPQIQENDQSFSIYLHEIYHENICSDRVRLSQILINVIGNAVKFTPRGGTIEVDLYEEASAKGPGYIRSHLYVKDNGIGMSKEFQTKIFDAFAREDSARVDKTAGGGMGLTITKYIVDALGGVIEVESEQGKGSCFHIAIDMEITTGQEKELSLPARNILVIDSDEIESGLAVSSLGSIGLRARAATSVEQALQFIEEQRGGEYPCHIVLLNWRIQKLGWTQSIQELIGRFDPDLPVIMLTDGEWDELTARAEATGIRGFIAKPLFRSSLYYGLRPFTEEKAPQREERSSLDLTGKRVLMAEDNELNWEIASEILSGFGLQMERAENGRICVEKFERSDPGWYDAILMDLRMPVMTGFEATDAIRGSAHAGAQTIPIIAISADAFDDDIQKCLAHGMNAHIAKPIDPARILMTLELYLR